MGKQPFKEIQLEIERYVRDTFPRKAGKMAVDHIRENFRREGYVDGGLHKWWDPVRKRKKKGKTAGQHKTLHSARNNLLNSIRYDTEAGKAIVHTDVEYAAIHNYGGEITHTITRKQRVKAMETHIRKTGAGHRKKNSLWKGLALTPRTGYTIRMPQRQFIGPSRELTGSLSEMVGKDIGKLINK